MTKSEAGRLGWLALQARIIREQGDISDYFRNLGKRGAARWYELYEWQPCNLNDFAIVRKSDGVVINTTSGFRR